MLFTQRVRQFKLLGSALIGLFVVTAIIGILASLPFPGDSSGVHDMSRAIEAEGEQWRMLASKGWRHWLQMIEHHAEELLDHFRIPGAIELRESVFGGWSDPAQGPERVRAEAQGIAHVIETEGLSQLGIEQADDLALGTESSGVIFDASATDQFEREVWQDEVAKLTKNGKLSRVGSNNVSFIPYIVTRRSRSSQHFFIPQPSSASDGNENF